MDFSEADIKNTVNQNKDAIQKAFDAAYDQCSNVFAELNYPSLSREECKEMMIRLFNEIIITDKPEDSNNRTE